MAFCAPPYKTHTRCKSAPHRHAILFASQTERKWRYADRHSTTQHDLPQRETGAQGPGPRAEKPQPHRPSGPQRGGQIHAHEAAGGGAGTHGWGHSGGRAAPSQKRAATQAATGLSAAGFRPLRRIDGATVPRLHGRPQGPAPPQGRHRQSHRHGRPAGEVQGEDPHPLRRPTAAGGHRAGAAGRAALPDLRRAHSGSGPGRAHPLSQPVLPHRAGPSGAALHPHHRGCAVRVRPNRRHRPRAHTLCRHAGGPHPGRRGARGRLLGKGRRAGNGAADHRAGEHRLRHPLPRGGG